MAMKFVYFFIGTTSEFIKISPVLKELKIRKIPFKIISAGQTKIHFEDLAGYVGKIKADIVLKEKLNKASVVHFLFWAVRTLITAPFILYEEFRGKTMANTYFIIFGDPVASTIGAIIAKLFNLTLVHIESGDLSFNLLEPFPEELCRNINIRLANMLFAPTAWAMKNLEMLKLKGRRISTTQNTIYEVCRWAQKAGKLPALAEKYKKCYLLIMHRQEHVIFRRGWSREILELVIRNASPDLDCLIPSHPHTVKIIQSLERRLPYTMRKRIHLIPWVSYIEFIKLVEKAEFVATDGASNQQEAYYLGKPCLSLRDHTEQIEGLNENVVLCKSSASTIKNFLKNYTKYRRKPIIQKERPSKIVVDHLFGN